MKTLDFDHRTRVARDSIRLVCLAVGVPLKDRRKVCRFIILSIHALISSISFFLHRLIHRV